MMEATVMFEHCPVGLGLFILAMGALVGALVGAYFAYEATNK